MRLLDPLCVSLARIATMPAWMVLLCKATLLLAIAWLVHAALARANPRWRVLLWRGVAVGLVLLPLGALGWPALEIPVPVPDSIVSEPTPAIVALRTVGPASRRSGNSPEVPASDELSTISVSTSAGTNLRSMPGAEATPAAEPGNRSIPWAAAMLGIWGLGVALLVVRLAKGCLRLARLLRDTHDALEEVVAEARRIAAALGCRDAVEVRTGPGSAVPFVCGLGRPVVVLPERMCHPAYRSQLPGVLAHELSHVRSHDWGWSLGLQMVSMLLWFHPLVWRIGSAHRAACDAVCDAVSASYLGDVRAYCRTLAALALEARASLAAGALAMARVCDVRRRIAFLGRKVFKSPLDRRVVVSVTLAGLIASTLLAGLRFAMAEPPVPASGGQAVAHPADARDASADAAPSAAKRPESTYTAIPRAEAALRVAEMEHRLNLEANRIHPGAVSPTEMRRSAAKCRETALELERAEATLRGDKPALAKIKVRYAQAKLDVSRAEYAMAVEANKRAPDSVRRSEVEHFKARVREAELELEKLTRPARPNDQTVPAAAAKGGTIVVEGTVTDSQGRPVAGATVGLFTELLRGDYPRAKTAADGHFRLPPCEPGEYTLAAAALGYAPDSHRVTVGPARRTVDSRLGQAKTLRLRVVDPQGKPLAGAAVLVGLSKPTLFLLSIPTTTDAEGRWSWAWTPNENLTIYISAKGYAQVTKELAPADREEVVVLSEKLWTVTGHVADRETKAPITKFRILKGRPASNQPNDFRWQLAQRAENADGRYRMDWDMYNDSYEALRIEADDYLPSEVRRVDADERQLTFDAELSKGRTIAGTVRSPDGKPLANADVILTTADRSLNVRNGREFSREEYPNMRTGPDGRFSFSPQREPYALIVLHDQGFARALNGMKEITIQPWARVEGTVRVGDRPDAKKSMGLRPIVTLPGAVGSKPIAQLAVRIQLAYYADTDSEGRFAFDRVPPGKAHVMRYVESTHDGRPMWSPSQITEIELAPGEVKKVDLRREGGP